MTCKIEKGEIHVIYHDSFQAAAESFRTLGTPMRLEIMTLLSEKGEMNITDLAEHLGLSNATISIHIKKLVNCGFIQIRTISAKHGIQKLCSVKEEKLIVDLISKKNLVKKTLKEAEINIGQYSNYEISPTCVIATKDSVIGEFDDIKYFSYPQRYNAAFLCFGKGYIEYCLPNSLNVGEVATELQLSFEISSEAPGSNEHYPSDIHFSINNINLGYWTSPGDYGEKKGYLTPAWHVVGLNQYGLLKILIINQKGTYIDGNTKLSDVTIDMLNIRYQSKIDFRIASPENAKNQGGVSLFGKGFGNYNQDIILKLTV